MIDLGYVDKKIEEIKNCKHGLTFDASKITNEMSTSEVRKLFPRLCGLCPLNCGYNGIAYVSGEHFIYGDW